MSISYNYFLPTNIYGTLRVTDLSFVGYTAVNANIYCQRNINCDGQMQCGQFHSLGTAYFDQVPTCITNATTATQLTNYQTVQALITAGGGSSILGLNNTWSGTNTFQIAIVSSGASITANTIPALSIVNNSLNQTQIATGFLLVSTLAQTFTGIKTFLSPIVTSGSSITANTIPALSIVNASINQTQIATGFLLVSTLAQNFTGIKTFLSPIVSSGESLTANTIPALSIVNNSINQTQIATGFQLVSTSAQTYSGIKTFSSAIVSSGESLTVNTIPALSIVNNSINQTQIATGFQLVSTSAQIFSGSKTFNGSATNQTVINITNTVSPLFYSGSIGFITACTTNYLNLTTSNFDSMMYIGQPIANGINQSYGFTICDYNSALTGIRISGTGAAGNCSINLNGTVRVDQLMTLENGLFVNGGNISTPNNAILGNIYSDIINNYDQTTGTDISLNPNNFVTCLVNAGNSSVLPTSVIGFGGLKIGWNCSNLSGETDFLNLANYTNVGGFNFYTMNASALPSLIGSLRPTALTITGSLTNNKIVNSSTTLPYHIQPNTVSLPTTTTGDTRAGFLIGWNGLSGSAGETDFTNLNQGGNAGGFLFGNIPVGGSYQKLVQISPSYSTGLRIHPQCGKLQLDDSNAGAFYTIIIQGGNQSFYNTAGINTQIVLQCGNATGVITNTMAMNTTTVQPFVNFSPASTTTFNASHPTTTLPIPTLSNQYATVGYVSSVVSPNLLPLNNLWTGTNQFKNSTNGIKVTPFNTLIDLYFGSGTGNQTNLVIGDYRSYTAVTGTGGQNIAITPYVSPCLTNSTGSSNIAIGTSCGTSQTLASQNIYIGTTSGNNISTGSNNICIGSNTGTGITSGSNNISLGNSAWSTGNTFSNCTVIGASAPAPLSSNSIILGSTAETVYVQGASQLTNTLLIGTTVASGNMQVNGNIIQPVGTLFTATGITTFTTIPPIVLFTPIAGMSFVLPTPNGTNAGQQIIIRRIATGSNTAVLFTATGAGLVFVPLNSGTGAASLSVLATWQIRLLCANNLYYQI